MCTDMIPSLLGVGVNHRPPLGILKRCSLAVTPERGLDLMLCILYFEGALVWYKPVLHF